MSNTRIWVYLIIASTMLMVVSGSLFVSFQHWVVKDSPNAISVIESIIPRSSTQNTLQVASAPVQSHRVMLSTAWDNKDAENKSSDTKADTVETSEAPAPQVVETHVTTNVATRVSSMPNPVIKTYSTPQPERLDLVQASDTPASFSMRPAVLTIEKPQKTAQSHNHASKLTPSFVIYQDELVVEFPKAIATTQNIKKAVTRLLLSHHLVRDGNLLSDKHLDYTNRPYFYRKVLDENKQPIRYPKQAYDYINYLMNASVEEVKDEDGEFVEVHIPLHESGLKGPAKTYRAIVNTYASKFDINPALVYAVMETESGFNPKAVSSSNAIGLMQLKPDTAGKDVYQYIDQKPGQPSKWDLFDSEKNIRMGIAYLSLLKHDYLSDIRNDKIKQMVTISSYNGGIKTVLGLFGKTPDKAIARLNRLNPKQVYRTLRYQHQSDETRRYLDKVLRAESRYKALLDDA